MGSGQRTADDGPRGVRALSVCSGDAIPPDATVVESLHSGSTPVLGPMLVPE